MRSCIVQSRRLNCVFMRSEGLYDAAEMRRMIKGIMELELFQLGAPTLCDMRGLVFDPGTASVLEVGRTPVDPPSNAEERSVAMVAGSDLGFGMMRMLAAMREQPGHRPRVFRTLAEAGEWLGLDLPGEAFPEGIEEIIRPHLKPGKGGESGSNLVLLRDELKD